MRRSSRFRRQAVIGYATIILLLSLPAAIAIGNAYFAAESRESATMKQIARLQRADMLARREAALTTAAWTYSPESIDRRRREFKEALDNLPGETTRLEHTTLLASIEQSAQSYLEGLDELAEMQNNGHSEQITPFFEQAILPRRDRLIRALETYVSHQAQRVEHVRRREVMAFQLMILVPATAFLLAIAASIWFARRSTHELRTMYEREQDATTRAEQATADRDELQRILAHDLRSPLNTIAMQAGLIQTSNDIAQAHHQAQSIERVTQHVSRLMQTLLDAGRLQDGQISIDPRPVDAAECLREAISLFQPQTQGRALDLQLPNARMLVMAEPERILQVMSNLLTNALRFTPEGGAITVNAQPREDLVQITVSDTGTGISADHLPHVFDRYFTVAGKQVKGTGLGLYITRSIIEAHGGTIWAENIPGNGAAFHFTIPRADNVNLDV